MAVEAPPVGGETSSGPVVSKAEPKPDGFAQVDVPRSLGRYILLRLIARGGMGEVYLASTTGLEGAERPVVVKVIRREHAKDPSFLARFLDEARVQAQLQHSGVAQVLDATMDEASGEPYVVVEHVEGRSLGDLRARAVQIGARLSWSEAASIATMIAEALAHVHERQDAAGRALAIVHRDLSPQNVMVSYCGDIKLIDFGTARGQNRRCHTVAGVVFAKPGYVAPEVANGNSGDARVDLYALGVMLWELCSGKRFLQGEASDHMALVAKNELAPPPIAEAVGAPAELDAIIAKLTAHSRDERYLASRVVATDLAKLLASAPALPGGERGIRARSADLMMRLFPSEPARSRREFAKLVAAARAHRGALPTPLSKAPVALAKRESEERAGLLPGTRYELRSEIGRGASSVVYEAHHVDLGRRAALKIIAEADAGSKDAAERFRREARALSRLSHPAIVKLHDFGMAEGGRLYEVLELLEGETLEAHLAREKGTDWREALGLARKTLEGLEVAHAAGIVHRDLKPANLFLTRAGELKLLDFGLAKAPDGTHEAAPEGTRMSGMTLFGTPEYMAPEQAASGRVDARADLYAVGCVLYEMVTGRLPFARESSVAILEAKIKGSPERPRERAPSRGIPGPVDELVMRALARHPSVRFQTAGEMIAAIDLALEAPAKARAGRRVFGYASLAGAMAFAVVLLAGQAPRVRSALPWLPSWSRSPVAVAALPEPPGAVAPPAEAAAPEEPAADVDAELDDGEAGLDVADLPGSEPIAEDMQAPAAVPATAVTPRKRASDKPRARAAAASPAPVETGAVVVAPPQPAPPPEVASVPAAVEAPSAPAEAALLAPTDAPMVGGFGGFASAEPADEASDPPASAADVTAAPPAVPAATPAPIAPAPARASVDARHAKRKLAPPKKDETAKHRKKRKSRMANKSK